MNVELRDFKDRYIVTFCGRVYRYRFPRRYSSKEMPKIKKINTILTAKGYHKISLTVDGKQRQFFGHRLVATLFLGDLSEKGLIVGHKDGTRTNNNYKNLKWITYKENSQDSKEHGTRVKGESQGLSVLKEPQVKEIYTLKGKHSSYVVAKMFGVAQPTIMRIWQKKTWRHLEL